MITVNLSYLLLYVIPYLLLIYEYVMYLVLYYFHCSILVFVLFYLLKGANHIRLTIYILFIKVHFSITNCKQENSFYSIEFCFVSIYYRLTYICNAFCLLGLKGLSGLLLFLAFVISEITVLYFKIR